jgi:hypothetical protein
MPGEAAVSGLLDHEKLQKSAFTVWAVGKDMKKKAM